MSGESTRPVDDLMSVDPAILCQGRLLYLVAESEPSADDVESVNALVAAHSSERHTLRTYLDGE